MIGQGRGAQLLRPRGAGAPGSALALPAVLNRRCPRCWTRPACPGGSGCGADPTPRPPPGP